MAMNAASFMRRILHGLSRTAPRARLPSRRPLMKLEWTREELLTDAPYDEPLVAGGVRCHGGFANGRYVSPRTENRVPAIAAWQRRLTQEGHRLVDVPQRFVPPHYP